MIKQNLAFLRECELYAGIIGPDLEHRDVVCTIDLDEFCVVRFVGRRRNDRKFRVAAYHVLRGYEQPIASDEEARAGEDRVRYLWTDRDNRRDRWSRLDDGWHGHNCAAD